MKAAVVNRYGPPDVVRIAQVEKPTPRDNELLVKVHATTVNRTDCGIRGPHPFLIRLFYGLARPRAAILGSEFAGEVEAVGSGVTTFEVGDRVFGFNTGLRGTHGEFGAHAEYMVIPENGALTTMPANVTYDEAAPCSEGATYAHSLITTAKIRSGQTVLVNGATGAIGSAAVQLLKSLGVSVTAVCATENIELVRRLGADRVIDYTAEDFTKDDQKYDVVLDAVGKSTFGRCRRLLQPRGLYLSTDGGPFFQNLILILVTPLFGGKKVMFGFPRRSQETMKHFKELIESGKFKPVIDRKYSLDEIVEAYAYVERGQKVGSVVISVDAAN